MTDWQEFLTSAFQPKSATQPGPVLICFVNRYLAGLDGIKYKIKQGSKIFEAQTTESNYCVQILPNSMHPIDVYVWSRIRGDYKKLDPVTPLVGQKTQVRKILKTYKAPGKTELHPKQTPITHPPIKPTPAAAAGPSPTAKQGVEAKLTKDESGLSQTVVERPVPDKITKEQLKKIFVAAKEDYLQQIADELNKDLAKFKLDTVFRRAHFFGQVRQETGPKAKGDAESLNHSSSGLMKTFGYYKNRKQEADQDGRKDLPNKRGPALSEEKQKVIANKVYGTRPKADDLGNIEGTDDGWNFRGRGLKQTTGRRNYRNFNISNKKYWDEEIDFTTKPDLVAQFPYSVRSAVAFWLNNDCWLAADQGMTDAAIDTVTKIVNSGEVRNHKAGKYKPHEDPVLNRRKFVKLAYAAFT